MGVVNRRSLPGGRESSSSSILDSIFAQLPQIMMQRRYAQAQQAATAQRQQLAERGKIGEWYQGLSDNLDMTPEEYEQERFTQARLYPNQIELLRGLTSPLSPVGSDQRVQAASKAIGEWGPEDVATPGASLRRLGARLQVPVAKESLPVRTGQFPPQEREPLTGQPVLKPEPPPGPPGMRAPSAPSFGPLQQGRELATPQGTQLAQDVRDREKQLEAGIKWEAQAAGLTEQAKQDAGMDAAYQQYVFDVTKLGIRFAQTQKLDEDRAANQLERLNVSLAGQQANTRLNAALRENLWVLQNNSTMRRHDENQELQANTTVAFINQQNRMRNEDRQRDVVRSVAYNLSDNILMHDMPIGTLTEGGAPITMKWGSVFTAHYNANNDIVAISYPAGVPIPGQLQGALNAVAASQRVTAPELPFGPEAFGAVQGPPAGIGPGETKMWVPEVADIGLLNAADLLGRPVSANQFDPNAETVIRVNGGSVDPATRAAIEAQGVTPEQFEAQLAQDEALAREQYPEEAAILAGEENEFAADDAAIDDVFGFGAGF